MLRSAFWGNTLLMSEEVLTLSPEASEKVSEFIDKSGGDGCLRLGVRGGGCSGFQYQLALDHERPNDLVFESEGQTILCSPDSFAYVAGSKIVWKETLMEQGFDVENPKAHSACGCGSSFRVDEYSGCAPESAL